MFLNTTIPLRQFEWPERHRQTLGVIEARYVILMTLTCDISYPCQRTRKKASAGASTPNVPRGTRTKVMIESMPSADVHTIVISNSEIV
jgi:hypothetical protein